MTAENMARHRHSPHYDFWKTLKVGYDHFEVTKRPPEVNVCEKKYVFNQTAPAGSSFNPQGACPPMSTPPALSVALNGFNEAYDAAYAKALKKYDGKIWYDPTEAERKALVADLRKSRSHDLAFAPTGSALKAGKLLDIDDVEQAQVAAHTGTAAVNQMATNPSGDPQVQAAQAGQTATTATTPAVTAIPVPQPNPLAPAPQTAQAAPEAAPKKPFWKLW
jgi:invasion protein IalB